MSNGYHSNHYIPIWYQKRFLPVDESNRELFYLDMHPPTITDQKGNVHRMKECWRFGPKKCFVETDLYTTHFEAEESTALEQAFFGPVDRNGKKAIEYFSEYAHNSVDNDALHNMMLYLGTQKLRTPKGLDRLRAEAHTSNHDDTLTLLVRLQQLFSAIWSECIWQIADASQSDTKFIISDHPVTVYNRRCGPRSDWCRGFNDPDIRFHGSHTMFPLSQEKILILTNLSWVRNPYQCEVKLRPNPNPMRGYVFDYTSIQIRRHLSEQEVRQINLIMKLRARRYVAAAQEDWVHPEQYVSKSEWRDFGHGYLLMPEPRTIYPGGVVILGYGDGSSQAFDAYGRRPWDREYDRETREGDEAASLERFKGEFARLFGPVRRGISFESLSLVDGRESDELFEHHLSSETRGRRKMKNSK